MAITAIIAMRAAGVNLLQIFSRWSGKKKGLLALFVVFAVTAGAAPFFKDKILLAIGDYLVIDDPLQPVDVVHVIAGDDYRVNYAIWLYKQGYAKYIFFTGGWCQTHGWHGLHGKQLAMDQGVPADAIAYDDSSVKSTYDEVALLKNWSDHRPSPIQSVMVVSDPFHMRRARWTYRRIFGNGTQIVMAPVPFDQTKLKREWWTDEDSQQFVYNEYIKSVYYVLRYQLTSGWLQNWLASLDKQ